MVHSKSGWVWSVAMMGDNKVVVNVGNIVVWRVDNQVNEGMRISMKIWGVVGNKSGMVIMVPATKEEDNVMVIDGNVVTWMMFLGGGEAMGVRGTSMVQEQGSRYNLIKVIEAIHFSGIQGRWVRELNRL